MPEPDSIDASHTAFFFDFDGTLAPFADHPGAARLAAGLEKSLTDLSARAGGALAIVSGRSVAQLEDLLDPLRFPFSGVHGLEYRMPGGELLRGPYDAELHERLAGAAKDFVSRDARLIAEIKPGAIAIHYRQVPALEAECLTFAAAMAAQDDRLALLPGKMVVEIRVGGVSKGDGIDVLLGMAPFKGRMPLFVGDDTTDEDAIAMAQEFGGIGFKIGPGPTAARYRFAHMAAFHSWLAGLAAHDGPFPLVESNNLERLRSAEAARAAPASQALADGPR